MQLSAHGSEDRQRMLRDAGFNNLSVEPADLDEEGQEGAGEGGRDLPNAVVEEEDEAEVDNAPERERARAGRCGTVCRLLGNCVGP